MNKRAKCNHCGKVIVDDLSDPICPECQTRGAENFTLLGYVP